MSRRDSLPDVDVLWSSFLEKLGGKSALRVIQGATPEQMTGIIADMKCFNHLEQAMIYTKFQENLKNLQLVTGKQKRVPSSSSSSSTRASRRQTAPPVTAAVRRPKPPRNISPTKTVPTRSASAAIKRDVGKKSRPSRQIQQERQKQKQALFQSKYAQFASTASVARSSSSSSLSPSFSSSSSSSLPSHLDTRGMSTATLARLRKPGDTNKPIVFRMKQSKYEDLGLMPRPSKSARRDNARSESTLPQTQSIPVFKSKAVETEADAIFARMQIQENEGEGELDPEYKEQEEFRAFVAETLSTS